MPTIVTFLPAARSAAAIFGTLVLIDCSPAATHGPLIEVPLAQPSTSLAPISIVRNAILPLCLVRNFTACCSWLPAAYLHFPPFIIVVVVSPGQPSFTSFRFLYFFCFFSDAKS